MPYSNIPIEEPIIVPYRTAGNTTRLVDYFIQVLFIKGFVLIRDHYSSDLCNRRIFIIVCNRLKLEHQNDWSKDRFKVDRINMTISYSYNNFKDDAFS